MKYENPQRFKNGDQKTNSHYKKHNIAKFLANNAYLKEN